MAVEPGDLPHVAGVAAEAYEQLAGRYGYAAHEVLRIAARAAGAGGAGRARPRRPAGRGRLRRAPRAGAHGRRRAAAPHPARAHRGRDVLRRRRAPRPCASRARWRAELGWDEARRRARPRPSARRPPPRGSWSVRRTAVRAGPQLSRPRRLDPTVCAALIAPLTALLLLAARARRRGAAGSPPSPSTARPRSTRWATSTWPATGRRRRLHQARRGGAAGLPRRAARGRLAAAGEARRAARGGDRGGRHRHRRRPAGRRVGGRRRGARRRSPRRRRPGARARRGARRRRRDRRRDRHGHQRGRLRRLVGRRRRPRRAAGRDDVDAARRRRWTSTPRATAGEGALAPARGASAPRATRSPPGRRPTPDGRTHVMARRLTGPTPSSLPAGPHARHVREPARRQRRLAGHRHRGRRLVRLGRVPPGRGRPLADRGAAAARLAVRGPVRDRRRGHEHAARGSTSTARASAARWRRPRATPSSAPTWTSSTPSSAATRSTRRRAAPRRHPPWRPPSAATSYVAWRTGAGENGDVRARRKDGEKGFEPEFVASARSTAPWRPARSAIGADRSGNAVVAMLQGARRAAVASPPRSTTGCPAGRSCSARSATAPASR